MKLKIIPLKIGTEPNLLGMNNSYVTCDIPSMNIKEKRLSILQSCSNSSYNNYCERLKQNIGKKIIVNVKSEFDLVIVPIDEYS